jgi:hypothetical protein
VWKRHQFYASPARKGATFTNEGAAHRRSEARKPVFAVEALLFAKELAAPLSCMVRDLSKSGARLEVNRGMRVSASPAYIPERFTIYLCPDKTEVAARIAWRDGRHFGVRFLGPRERSRRNVA